MSDVYTTGAYINSVGLYVNCLDRILAVTLDVLERSNVLKWLFKGYHAARLQGWVWLRCVIVVCELLNRV